MANSIIAFPASTTKGRGSYTFNFFEFEFLLLSGEAFQGLFLHLHTQKKTITLFV